MYMSAAPSAAPADALSPHESYLHRTLLSTIWSKFDLLSEYTGTHSRGYSAGLFSIGSKTAGKYNYGAAKAGCARPCAARTSVASSPAALIASSSRACSLRADGGAIARGRSTSSLSS